MSDPATLLDGFARSGNRVACFELPEHRRLVGFGPSEAWAFYEDELGVQWLERYLIPYDTR